MTPQKAARPLCSQYEQTFTEAVGPANDYLEESAPALSDAYFASGYQDSNGSYSGWSEDDLERNVSQLALQRLKAVTRPKITEDMLEKFVGDSLFVCHLGTTRKETAATLEAAEDRADAITELAANVPWHPQAFQEYSDGLAYRFLEYGSEYTCDYSGSSCWGMEIIARDGCPSNVYAQLQVQDASGAAIDYTNDTLGTLHAGQVGRMVFNWFAPEGVSGVTGHLTEFNCY